MNPGDGGSIPILIRRTTFAAGPILRLCGVRLAESSRDQWSSYLPKDKANKVVDGFWSKLLERDGSARYCVRRRRVATVVVRSRSVAARPAPSRTGERPRHPPTWRCDTVI